MKNSYNNEAHYMIKLSIHKEDLKVTNMRTKEQSNWPYKASADKIKGRNRQLL